jgi:Winged helix DNA-binding domain
MRDPLVVLPRSQSRRVKQGTVLDRQTLNRTLLARQFLLERVDADPLSLVEQLVGLQAQVPLDPYVACWTRLRSFDPDALGRALLDRRAVRMTLLRATLHLVSRADALRLRPLLQEMLERAFAASPFGKELAGVDLAPVLERGAELVEREPQTLTLLRAVLAEQWPEHDPNALAYAVRYLVPLVQVTPRGVWGRTAQPTVTTLAGWLGEQPAAPAAVDEYVLRYLRAFGPASTADLRTWSGLTDLSPVVARLRPRLRAYRDEQGRELLDVHDGLVVDAATPPVRFLGQFDNVFLAHADRSRIMATVRWDASFAHRGAFLVDGYLAGAWKLTQERGHASLAVEARVPVPSCRRRELRAEAEAFLAFRAPHASSRSIGIESV